ncbi:hypothetical protein ACSBR2_004624 [Camellia fascicularis]
MASPPLQVEDQTDENFFDILVDEGDTGISRSGPSLFENEGSDKRNAFSKLSIGEADAAKVDSSGNVDFGVNSESESGGGTVSASLDGHGDNLIAEESVSLTPVNVVQSNDVALQEKCELDSKSSNNSGSSGMGVKEVDWSSFNSASHLHNGSGTGSFSDFFNELGSGDLYGKEAGNSGVASNNVVGVPENMAGDFSSLSSIQHKEGQNYGSQIEQAIDGQDLNSSQYWENLYPGWRFDPNTGQWHQLDGYNATMDTQQNLDASIVSAGDGVATEQRSDDYYFQQTAQSVLGNVDCRASSFTDWNQGSQQNVEYPAHMVFDPQYPGWYYDTIAQEWRLLESYTSAMNQPTNVHHNQQSQDGIVSAADFLPEENHRIHGNFDQVGKFESQDRSSQGKVMGWAGSVSDSNQQRRNTWKTASLPNSGVISISDNYESHNPYDSSYHATNSADQQNQQMWFKPSGTATLPEQTSQSFGSVVNSNSILGSQTFIPAVNFLQHSNQHKQEPSQQMHFSPAYFDSQKLPNFLEQPLGTQFPHASSEGRSSAGRPAHALVTFGFGGKLVVMKDNSSLKNLTYGGQDSDGSVINILNLMDVAMDKTDASGTRSGVCDYLYTLCQQSFPSPLVCGNVGSREVNKWIDEKIANCKSPDMDYRKGELLRLFFSLLKIACQYYGKLRSPFGTDHAMKESDCPESSVAKLFASAKRNVSEYGAFSRCLQNLPSEGEIQATAFEVQKLLVSGRIREALQCAQEGQLWGPALVLAAQLGDQFYGATVKQMALRQLIVGSPLRTLCLLIAGQPADVFSDTSSSSLPGGVISQHSSEIGATCMLDEWEENLAIITANRTKDDELVVIHLGDCLWKERGEVTAAHICYLVAEANCESYSDTARICLIGADHLKFPRTYASPEAIQRTELYEYSKVLGNPQFSLLPFQPYKLIYAHMLAEVGKVSDSLKYCQAMLKCLKTSRVPEVDTWKNLLNSLEERIKIHQQGGYSTNMAPAKLVGKLLNLFDSTAHRVVGGLPPSVPSTSHSSAQCNEHDRQKVGPRVSNSQSTMAMSSLMPSASTESEWKGGNNRSMHNRSISEPDFGRTPRKEGSFPDMQEKASGAGGSSRLGRIGSQIFQKTVGLVLRSRSDRQAKLGEKNKFYYDENLKRWLEEGAEPPGDEPALPPPPTSASLQNRTADHTGPKIDNLHSNSELEYKSPSSEWNSGIPPIPPSLNHFSAHGRMGVRARYVDTFNKGGGTPANLFQSPSLLAAKSGAGPVGPNAKFFIPTPVALGDETVQTTGENLQEAVFTNESPSSSVENNSFPSPLTSASTSTSSMPTMKRIPSMDNIVSKRSGAIANSRSSLPPHSRRTASWSGSFSDTFNPPKMTELKPLAEVLGMPPSLFMPGDELHEVEL